MKIDLLFFGMLNLSSVHDLSLMSENEEMAALSLFLLNNWENHFPDINQIDARCSEEECGIDTN